MNDTPTSRRNFLLGTAAAGAAGIAAVTAGVTTPYAIQEHVERHERKRTEARSRNAAQAIANEGAIMTLAKNAVALYVTGSKETHPEAIAGYKNSYNANLHLIDEMLAKIEHGAEFRDRVIKNLTWLKEACPNDDKALMAASDTIVCYAEALPDGDLNLSAAKQGKESSLPLIDQAVDAVIAHLREIEIAKSSGNIR